MGAVGLLCKGFLGLNKVETHGMEDFLKLLDERKDVEGRERGLITGMQLQLKTFKFERGTNRYTVSNHISVYVRLR
jgi:hypothetical protein